MKGYSKPIEGMSSDWPYPVHYGKENEIDADVLILGGGVAGCHAAISAAKRGSKVAIVDKGPVIRSGSGGSGVDHWHCAVKNPCCKLTMDDMIDFFNSHPGNFTSEYGNGITFYILCQESYKALLDCEKMGIKFRDEEDEFLGAFISKSMKSRGRRLNLSTSFSPALPWVWNRHLDRLFLPFP